MTPPNPGPPALDTLAHALLDAARAAGADAADVIVLRGTSVGIGVRDGRLEEAERAEVATAQDAAAAAGLNAAARRKLGSGSSRGPTMLLM